MSPITRNLADVMADVEANTARSEERLKTIRNGVEQTNKTLLSIDLRLESIDTTLASIDETLASVVELLETLIAATRKGNRRE